MLELAKTLAASSSYNIDVPPPPSSVAVSVDRKSTKTKPTLAHEPAKSSIPLVGATEPPVLPPGTYSITPSLPPMTLSYQEAFHLEQALAAKQQAIEDCSKLIDAAVEELGVMNEASDKFWEKIRMLKDGENGRGQWAVLPRPDFGKTMVDGEKVRDVIIPYALDEGTCSL